MTGHGEACCQGPGLAVAVEVRSVNNRHFKLVLRTPNGFNSLESEIESLVRQSIQRGSVQLSVRVDRESARQARRVNEDVFCAYYNQLLALEERLGRPHDDWTGSILSLPGVISEELRDDDPTADWPVVQQTVTKALEHLLAMRRREGAAMERDLLDNCQHVADRLDQIAELAPRVVQQYQNRLLERINQLLSEHMTNATPADVVREVGICAERCDISEEIVRLRSHLQQFRESIASPTSTGRKLDFVVQEMSRETNTIGSKANERDIARHVVEIKTMLERIREMVQNVE